jgi:hypothetical protein
LQVEPKEMVHLPCLLLHTNPVSGEEQDTKIQLPKGFIFKVVNAAKTRIMRILTPNLNFDYSGKNAFYSVVEFKGPQLIYG